MDKNNKLMYSTTFINQNYRIKVYGVDVEGKRINKLVGVSGLIELVGIEFLNKFITHAIKNINADSTRCRLRRGLQVTLYNK